MYRHLTYTKTGIIKRRWLSSTVREMAVSNNDMYAVFVNFINCVPAMMTKVGIVLAAFVTLFVCLSTQLKLNKKLSCGCHATRTLLHVLFPTLRPATRALLAGFSDSQSFTRGQLLAAYWPYFPTFAYFSSIWRPQWGGSLRAIGFIFCTGKLEWLGEGHVTIDSSRLDTIHQRDRHRHTATSPQQ